MSEPPAIRSSILFDVQCDKCKALHPLTMKLGDALPCMDRLNNSDRPCPMCGVKRQWVLKEASPLERQYYCPNLECQNSAFEPGLCSDCGSLLILDVSEDNIIP